MYAKCIYFDLDGTLVSYDGSSVSNRTIMAMQYLKQKDIKIGIATGRSLYFTDYFSKALDVDMPIICVNGAWIVSPKNFTTISTKFIDDESRFRILEWLKNENKDFLVYTTTGVYGTNKEMPFYKRLKEVNLKLNEKNAPNFLEFEFREEQKLSFYKSQQLLKILISFNDAQEKVRYENILKSYQNISFAMSQSGNIDIFNKEADKSYAIIESINNFRISRREVMVFGDNENDILMFKAFPTKSVALKNAEYKVRKAAQYTTDFTCEQEGVADFIFKNF